MTGELPEWYVKKHHYLWYKELTGRIYVREEPGPDAPAADDEEPVEEKIIEEEASSDAVKPSEVAA